jgi:S-DNA-T family DNA segregation ATPase FtsK/SpoIIIE
VVWGIDLKGGMELRPWAGCLGRLATTPQDAVALLADARAIRDHRAATTPGRLWEPGPDRPALVIVVDEYAELPDQAKNTADSLARVGRAVMVNLLVATQRPTQAAMGGGAARAQMDVRICLRVRERRDTDLILGQGSWSAGWRADLLDQPGKFLLSDPEHTAPRPARAYRIGDPQIADHARYWAARRPLLADPPPADPATTRPDSATAGPAAGQPPPSGSPAKSESARLLRERLSAATGPDGVSVAELVTVTGKSRTWVYDQLRELAAQGRAAATRRRGYWRAIHHPPASHDG